ncbi:uncharacterized protein EV422DRAFT_510312 [Fimicolochytrium jonesii]|uniref:uncharacterized protein n=1 Tax=Fimicolochytrium jonesii TaxID=1396493 RepID=UPI0022FDCD50|nr:uncharacterized protein EV422DRAFT_510312 [Fimicolochytrium jonesii]KAI8815754.1 hypothetical protein EV422DRAFT_510312 [Fimicolochytrium jonesii]
MTPPSRSRTASASSLPPTGSASRAMSASSLPNVDKPLPEPPRSDSGAKVEQEMETEGNVNTNTSSPRVSSQTFGLSLSLTRPTGAAEAPAALWAGAASRSGSLSGSGNVGSAGSIRNSADSAVDEGAMRVSSPPRSITMPRRSEGASGSGAGLDSPTSVHLPEFEFEKSSFVKTLADDGARGDVDASTVEGRAGDSVEPGLDENALRGGEEKPPLPFGLGSDTASHRNSVLLGIGGQQGDAQKGDAGQGGKPKFWSGFKRSVSGNIAKLRSTRSTADFKNVASSHSAVAGEHSETGPKEISMHSNLTSENITRIFGTADTHPRDASTEVPPRHMSSTSQPPSITLSSQGQPHGEQNDNSNSHADPSATTTGHDFRKRSSSHVASSSPATNDHGPRTDSAARPGSAGHLATTTPSTTRPSLYIPLNGSPPSPTIRNLDPSRRAPRPVSYAGPSASPWVLTDPQKSAESTSTPTSPVSSSPLNPDTRRHHSPDPETPDTAELPPPRDWKTMDPAEVGRLLFDDDFWEIPVDKVAEVIGKAGVRSEKVLGEFMKGFGFGGVEVDEGIRAVAEKVLMAGDSQVLLRILTGFARRWWECNPDRQQIYLDPVIVETYANCMMLLNTDLHVANAGGRGNRMTKAKWVPLIIETLVQNGEGMDLFGSEEGKVVKKAWIKVIEPVLKRTFDRIAKTPLPQRQATKPSIELTRADDTGHGLFNKSPSMPRLHRDASSLSLASTISTGTMFSISDKRRTMTSGLGGGGNSPFTFRRKSDSRTVFGPDPTAGGLSLDSQLHLATGGHFLQDGRWVSADDHATSSSPGSASDTALGGGPDPTVRCEGILIRKHRNEANDVKAKNRQWIKFLCALRLEVHAGTLEMVMQKLEREGNAGFSASEWGASGSSDALEGGVPMVSVATADSLGWGGTYPRLSVGTERMRATSEVPRHSVRATPAAHSPSSPSTTQPFNLLHSLATPLPPPGYSPLRPHVFTLRLSDGQIYLYHAPSADIVREWVHTINIWAARKSKEPLAGSGGNAEYGWGPLEAERVLRRDAEKDRELERKALDTLPGADDVATTSSRGQSLDDNSSPVATGGESVVSAALSDETGVAVVGSPDSPAAPASSSATTTTTTTGTGTRYAASMRSFVSANSTESGRSSATMPALGSHLSSLSGGYTSNTLPHGGYHGGYHAHGKPPLSSAHVMQHSNSMPIPRDARAAKEEAKRVRKMKIEEWNAPVPSGRVMSVLGEEEQFAVWKRQRDMVYAEIEVHSAYRAGMERLYVTHPPHRQKALANWMRKQRWLMREYDKYSTYAQLLHDAIVERQNREMAAAAAVAAASASAGSWGLSAAVGNSDPSVGDAGTGAGVKSEAGVVGPVSVISPEGDGEDTASQQSQQHATQSAHHLHPATPAHITTTTTHAPTPTSSAPPTPTSAGTASRRRWSFTNAILGLTGAGPNHQPNFDPVEKTTVSHLPPPVPVTHATPVQQQTHRVLVPLKDAPVGAGDDGGVSTGTSPTNATPATLPFRRRAGSVSLDMISEAAGDDGSNAAAAPAGSAIPAPTDPTVGGDTHTLVATPPTAAPPSHSFTKKRRGSLGSALGGGPPGVGLGTPLPPTMPTPDPSRVSLGVGHAGVGDAEDGTGERVSPAGGDSSIPTESSRSEDTP